MMTELHVKLLNAKLDECTVGLAPYTSMAENNNTSAEKDLIKDNLQK